MGMETLTAENGSMAKRMAKAFSLELMAVTTRAISKMTRSTGKASLFGTTRPPMKVNGRMGIAEGWDFMNQKTVILIEAIGKMINFTDKERISGMTAENTRDNTRMTKNTDKEHFFGLTDESTMAIGIQA